MSWLSRVRVGESLNRPSPVRTLQESALLHSITTAFLSMEVFVNRLLLALPAFFALAACSSTPTQHGGYQAGVAVSVPAPEQHDYLINPGDRTPAGEPRLYWAEESRDINIGPQGGAADFAMTINRIQQWTEQEAFIDYRFVTRLVWEAGTCQDWDCSQAGGGGSSPLWDAFYSAPRERKPKALADAIKGVGEPTALKLIAAGTFQRKPRSWEAFKEAIRSAERAGHISRDITYQVTVKYADDNLVNLGYTQASCRRHTYACDVLVERFVQEQFTNYRPVTRTRIVESFPRRFQVVVRDPKLQSFEQDTIRITAGREPNNVTITADRHMRYSQQMSIQGDLARIELVGTDRIRRAVPNSSVVRNSYQLRGNVPTFTVAVDPRFIPAAGGNDQLVVKYRVGSCKTILSICGKKTESAEMVQPITGSETNIVINNVKGLKSWVKFSVARKNSPWYSDDFTAEVETDDVRQK